MKKRVMVVIVMMIGLMFLTGCTAALVNNLDPVKQGAKKAMEAAPSYANTPEAKELNVPEMWKDEAMKDKVLFEGFMVQTPDGPAERLRISYIPKKNKRDKSPDTFIITIVKPEKNGLDARSRLIWLDWKDHPDDLKGIVSSFEGAKIPVGDTMLKGSLLHKVSPSFVRKTFMGDEPVLCRSLVEQKEIPFSVSNRLGMSIDNSMNPVVGVLSITAMALPGVGMAIAPAITGMGAAATAVGYGAAAVAGQTAVGLASTMAKPNVASDSESAGLPPCFSISIGK